MADNSTPDYKSLFLQAEERLKQAEDERRREKERREKAEERNRQTTFMELMRYSHDLLSRTLEVETPSRSTSGKIPPPTHKHCPTRLEYWNDCSTELSELYRSVCSIPLSSEQELHYYERLAVEDHVRDFSLGDGIQFSNHTNSLDENEPIETDTSQSSSIHQPRPDQFCIHRVNGNSPSLVTTVEYKPPHKLPVAILLPTNQEAKLRYYAEQLTCSAIVQEYHVMIQERLEYSYITNGIARVLLRVPQDNPSTLYYFFCNPNSEMDPEVDYNSQLLRTSVARTLCLCLLAFRSSQLWTTSFDHTYSQIPEAERQQQRAIPDSDSTTIEFPSPDPGSAFEPSSSPPDSLTADGRQVATRSQASYAPLGAQRRSQSPDSFGSDTNHAMGRKRIFSQATSSSSPSAQSAARLRETSNNQGSQSRGRDAQFCTQRCLLGLQTGGILDDCCPNVMLHRQSSNDRQHPITSESLVDLLKAQLDENIDQCIPVGSCGAYGAPFKLTCDIHGYTVIGKGTTSRLWKEVSREAQVYQLLQKAQGSAVPVFLGTINLKKIYSLHGAGEIRHMLVMGWGGESTAEMELAPWLCQEIRRSKKEIKSLGIIHEDLRCDNILWNKELGRALIIDFHRSSLRTQPISHRQRTAKRQLSGVEPGDAKCLRIL
ncbi:hypothetical protein BDV11DRAFT_207429 [Aspergillus similis]